MNKSTAITLLALAFGFAGCGSMSTIDSRSKEMSSTYAAASGRDKNLMNRGLIGPGFTPNMVYIALDKPDSMTKLPDGHTERWIYRNFSADPGSFTLGATKVVSGGSFSGGSSTSSNPGSSNSSSSHTGTGAGSVGTRSDASQAVDAWQRNLVVTFTDGKLTSMEMLQM